MSHDPHLLQTRGVEARVRGGHHERRVDIRGKDMLRAATAGQRAAKFGASRKDGLNHGLLLVGNESYGNPIPDLGKFCIGPASFVHALAGGLREKFRISGPDAEEMFILPRHASRRQTLGLVGRELLVEVSIPAQLRQVHMGVLIDSFMAYSLRPSPTATKAEVGDSTFWAQNGRA